MSRIIVVEDDPSQRADLVDFLALRGFTVEGVDRAAALRAALSRGPADVIVLDIGLPDGDGRDLAREIRRGSACGIVMLTAHAEIDDRVAGLESGADVYLVKHVSLREIDATIRSLLRRLHGPDAGGGETVGPASWRLDAASWRLTAPDGASVVLSASEVTFLSTLIARIGETCSRDDILRALGRTESRPDGTQALNAVVRRLRRKIETGIGRDAPIKMVYGGGYVFTAPARIDSSGSPG